MYANPTRPTVADAVFEAAFAIACNDLRKAQRIVHMHAIAKRAFVSTDALLVDA